MILSLFLIASPMEDQRQALEFQYESQLSDLRAELVKTQKELAEAKGKLFSCSDEEIPNQRIQAPTKKQIQKSYQDALRLLDEDKWNEALLAFEGFVQSHPRSPLADNAVLMMARIYEIQNESLLAKGELQRLLRNYPKSERRKEAIASLRRIEDGFLRKSEGK